MTAIKRILLLTLLSAASLSRAWGESQHQAPLAELKELHDYASDGCQLSELPRDFWKRHVKLSIPSGGKDRVFHVFIPSLYQPGVPTPLILSFHGHGKTAQQQEELAGFSTDEDLTYNPGWIVVTPQGLNRSWEGGPYAPKDYSDVEFTAELLDYLGANLCIDESRIYAAGKSNGGGFVGKLACSALSSRIAAFAPVSGAFYTNVSEPCDPSRLIIPIIDFHGMADTTIRYYGGNNTQGFWLDPIPEVLRAWAKRQNCVDPQTPTNVEKKKAKVNKNMKLEPNMDSDDEYWRSSWSCGITPGAVETIVAYNITGLKHAWPSTKPNGDSDVPTVLNATPIIITFFAAWSLAGPT